MLLLQQRRQRAREPNATTTDTVAEGGRIAPSTQAPAAIELSTSLPVEQGLVLLGGYMGTSALQALSLAAARSGLSTSAGWIIFPDFVYYAWSPLSNEVQEGVSKMWHALRCRQRWRGDNKGADKCVDGGGSDGGVDDGHGVEGGEQGAAAGRSWRWSGVNTMFAAALTLLGVAFTAMQVRSLARAHDEELACQRESRLHLVRERAALGRVET